MNLHLLRIFHRVAEVGSFSLAAQAMHISQPAVSRAVRELEIQLGLPLLERGQSGSKVRHGVQLTVSGQLIYRHAQGIFTLEQRAEQEIAQIVGLQRGSLAIGASTTVAGYWLPPQLASFNQTHPDIEVTLRVGNTQEVVQWLSDCRVDIGLVEGEVAPRSAADPLLDILPWQREPLLLLAAPHHALASGTVAVSHDSLSGCHWLLREPGSGTRLVCERFWHEHGIRPASHSEIASNEAIARMVAAGAGIALLPQVQIQDLLQLGALAVLRLPSVPRVERQLYTLRLQGRSPSPALQVFIRRLAACRP